MPTDLDQNIPLPWYLKNQDIPGADTGADELSPAPFPWPVNSDEEVYVAFKLSLNQFVAMLSSIDVGSAIAYQDDALKVYWWFIRNFGGDAMQFCAKVIDCIENDADVRAALSNFINEHPGGTTYPKEIELPPGATTGNILGPNPECDPDILWTQCIGIVQTANRMVIDFLETWETYNNSGETLNAIIGAIPYVGEVVDVLGIDSVIAYANSLVDAVAEAYSADYSLEYENALACEIFCAAKPTCNVSLDLLVGIMNTRISNQLNLDNGLELMLSLIDADVSGFNVADLYLAAFFNMLKLANLVLPITWGIEAYLRTIRVFNEPSDDWEVLCEDCPPEPAEGCFDLTASPHAWYASLLNGTPTPAFGHWVAGEGLAPAGSAYTPPADKQFFYTRPAQPGDPIVQAVTFNFNATATGFQLARQGGAPIQYSGTPVTSITFSEISHPTFFPLNLGTEAIVITFSPYQHAPSAAFRAVEFCYETIPE